MQAGFLQAELLIPQFILAELQHIADSSNDIRRARGRAGLELVTRLQNSEGINLKVLPRDLKGEEKADDMLVVLAKSRKSAILTTDFNLNKVASIQGVRVLNVNELSHGLRAKVLPGEQVKIKLVQRGSDPHQGVGYLDDGTMVVVDHASRNIGREVTVKVSRIMQTVAGQMLFAQLLSKPRRQTAEPAAKRPN